jgi:hypothetical protein
MLCIIHEARDKDGSGIRARGLILARFCVLQAPGRSRVSRRNKAQKKWALISNTTSRGESRTTARGLRSKAAAHCQAARVTTSTAVVCLCKRCYLRRPPKVLDSGAVSLPAPLFTHA